MERAKRVSKAPVKCFGIVVIKLVVLCEIERVFFFTGGASQECGRGVLYFLLCTMVRSLYGCATGSAAGR